eukprot:TRINITY_DN68270_c0_g1_i1.p1 TRINITY_DN68270_c0_g1~~TRINITY_DN68270_c0_g1_i1.p1  ORF type:complete len:514 (+),score=57.83 TRINITY_DN68270_c0_g1_i1:35-1576(+)
MPPCRAELSALRDLVALLAPVVAGNLVNVAADRWTLAFVGHFDYEDRSHYDGAGIGKMYSNITGLSLGVSATLGLATFASQAHGGGRSAEQIPVFVRRAWLLLFFCFVFALTAAISCEPLLLFFDQPPAVAHTSARYAQVQLLGVPFFWFSNSLNIALNATKRTSPGLLMNLVSSACQLVLCYVFTNPAMCHLGYLGVALGRALGGVVSCLVIVTYVCCQKLQHVTWRLAPTSEPVVQCKALKAYLKVSVPAALVVWSEWWAFEVLSIMVGLTPDAELNLAAHGTMFNIIVVFYMCWTGTCVAVCTLVGNALGAGQNAYIPAVLRAAFIFSAVSSAVVALGYEGLKGSFAAAFTEDERVRELMESSSMGLVLSVPFYAQLMTFYGALRGANFQKPGILGTLIGYWVVGLPSGWLLGCRLHWPTPLLGVWMGNVIALVIASSWVVHAVFFRIDWMSVGRVEGVQARLCSPERSQSGSFQSGSFHREPSPTTGSRRSSSKNPHFEVESERPIAGA